MLINIAAGVVAVLPALAWAQSVTQASSPSVDPIAVPGRTAQSGKL